MKDNIFNKEIKKQFEFDEEVASVFDDMLNRSVPYYKDMLNLSVKFALLYANKDYTIYDLGCSTATTLIQIAKQDKTLQLVGIDNSSAMIELAQKKINAYKLDNIKLINDDILNINLNNSSVVIANYTLQFIRPLYRLDLVKKIYNSLIGEGIFLFSEKIININKLFV